MRFLEAISLLSVVLLSSCTRSDPGATIFLAQGLMSGEPTSTSIILQSRLTSSDTLIHGDIPGSAGIGRFEISINTDFENVQKSEWLVADSISDFILKYKFKNLEAATSYYYRLHYGEGKENLIVSPFASFKTNPGIDNQAETSFVVVTGMNYYHFHYGKYKRADAYTGEDKHLGYPALKSILDLNPDFFIGTGDNVYFGKSVV